MTFKHGLVLVLPLAAVCLSEDSAATVLQFDQARDAATQTMVVPTAAGSSVPQDYGDHVNGAVMNVPGGQFTYGNGGEGFTPNVTVDYSSGTDVFLWTTQYGDLTNVLYAHALAGIPNPNSLTVRLAADSGFQVQLYAFDLAGWSNADYTISAVSVLGGMTTLFSQSNVLVEGNFTGPRHSTFNFASPLIAQDLSIVIDFSNLPGGTQDNIGLDNIRFGQTSPSVTPVSEPGAALLLVSGLLGLAGWMRSRLYSAAPKMNNDFGDGSSRYNIASSRST
jgi:hypothetical protein